MEIENASEKNFIKGVVDRFEERHAVIKISDGNEILWPQKYLSDEIKKGMEVYIEIKTEENKAAEKEKLAKEIINQILKKE